MRTLCSSIVLIPALALVALGCGDDSTPTEDAAVRDTATADTGMAQDTGVDAAPSDAGDDGSAPDASGSDAAVADAGGDAAAVCDAAAEGEPCSDEGLVCGSCPDRCTLCNVLECRDGQWARREVFPPPCFSCGPSLQCVASERYCSVFLPGVPEAEPTYECVLPPVDCEASLTCECLMRREVVGDCREEGTGRVTVTVAAP